MAVILGIIFKVFLVLTIVFFISTVAFFFIKNINGVRKDIKIIQEAVPQEELVSVRHNKRERLEEKYEEYEEWSDTSGNVKPKNFQSYTDFIKKEENAAPAKEPETIKPEEVTPVYKEDPPVQKTSPQSDETEYLSNSDDETQYLGR